MSTKGGRSLHIKEKDIKKADNWFTEKGYITVFVCRFIPIVRSLISIPAGMNKMPLTKFIIYTTSGTIIWNSVLVCLGRLMGKNWMLIVEYMNKFSYLILFIIILIIFYIIYRFYFKKRKKKKV